MTIENAMCSHEDYVSPSLRRRLRTHEEIVREEGERTERAETGPHGPWREAVDDVEPTR